MHLDLAASASAIESPEVSRSLKLGEEVAALEGVCLHLSELWGCASYTARLSAANLLALLFPLVCGICCMLVVYELLSGSLSYDIDKPPSAV